MVTWNKPPALAMQLDRCDVCGDKYHRKDLVLTQVEFLDLEAENAFTYSSYNTGLWTMSGASDVTSSTVATYGNRCDNVRLSLDNDNNLTYLNSPKVWSGNGTMYMNADTGFINQNTDLVVSAQVGPHEQNTSPEMTVVIGVCDDDASNKSAMATYTIAGTTRVWAYSTVYDLVTTGLQRDTATIGDNFYYSWRFYFQVTNAGNWWIDEMQYEAGTNVTSGSSSAGPGNFVRTSGTKVKASNNPEQSMVTSRKVCPSCQELILSKSERFGRTDEPPVDDPVDTWNQEF